MENYKKYQNSICEIPSFLNKYLELPVMQRLKDISLLCGMDYASPNMYDFAFYISRYDHSLNVALITWKLTQNKTETLAALFHDISTPVFSHVIDYMNKDYIEQESTEKMIVDVLLTSRDIIKYLKEDNVNIADILDFKKFSTVDLPRPSLCADRLENLIGVGMAWVQDLSYEEAQHIIASMYLTTNEKGQKEIAVSSRLIGEKLVDINNKINTLTHTDEDTYMMLLLADIVKKSIEEGLFIYEDLYRMTEHRYLALLERNLSTNSDLADMYHLWKTVEPPVPKQDITIKELTLNPLVNGKRLYTK